MKKSSLAYRVGLIIGVWLTVLADQFTSGSLAPLAVGRYPPGERKIQPRAAQSPARLPKLARPGTTLLEQPPGPERS